VSIWEQTYPKWSNTDNLILITSTLFFASSSLLGSFLYLSLTLLYFSMLSMLLIYHHLFTALFHLLSCLLLAMLSFIHSIFPLLTFINIVYYMNTHSTPHKHLHNAHISFENGTSRMDMRYEKKEEEKEKSRRNHFYINLRCQWMKCCDFDSAFQNLWVNGK